MERKIKEKEVKLEDKYIRWFSELGKDDIKIAGGKGANLGEMHKLELPVPSGFVIISDAYDYFLEETEIKEKIYDKLKNLDEEDTEKLEKTAREIREFIEKAEMPKDLREEILESYEVLSSGEFSEHISEDALSILKIKEPAFVAVRSSATAEDSKTASFAGQQETFLNVKGREEIIDKVKKCFASLFTARSIYYRIKKSFRHEDVLIAVIIQKMINSDKSGVIFSRDPVENRENVVIEAVFGLGEGIVSGRIKPDYYLVSRDLKILKTTIADKKIAIVRTSSGKAEEIKLTEERSRSQVLKESEIRRLAGYALGLEEHYKSPQDIEFAIDSGEIYIVQTRPVTTLEKKFKKEEISGKELLSGLSASPGIGTGHVKIIMDLKDLNKIKKGDVLVTKMTNPDMVVSMQKASAIVTDEGGLTSHAAIVSREMGIPAIVGTQKATSILRDNLIVTVDGFNGKVYEGSREELKIGEIEKAEIKEAVKTETKIKVMVDLPTYAERASKTGIKSVGLTRLEGIIAESGKHPYFFLKSGEINKYEELIFSGLKKIAEYFDELWIRTSDIRSDEYMNLEGSLKEKEANPMLGMHGIRASLKHLELLKAELKAMKRISERNKKIGILLPQVISVEEVKKVKNILEQINFNEVELGVMIETPAAVEIIEDLCKEGIDFISFGTNDLTQFTLALDRGNEEVQELFDEMHPAVLLQLKKVIKICKNYNIKTSICGQAGSKKEMVEFLIRNGIDSISVNADKAREISEFVRELEEKGLKGSELEEEEENEEEIIEAEDEKQEERDEDREQEEKVERDDKGRILYDIICSECGEESKIPFEPKPDKKVYCRKCFEKIRKEKDLKTEKSQEEITNMATSKQAKQEKTEAKQEKQEEWKNVDFGIDVFANHQKSDKDEETEEEIEEELSEEDETETKEEEKKVEEAEESEEDEDVLDIF